MAEGAEGITLPDHVPRNVARAFKRLHQTLGHPSNPDLARHLRLAGGHEQAVKAALQIKRQTCARHARPQISRAGRLVDFGLWPGGRDRHLQPLDSGQGEAGGDVYLGFGEWLPRCPEDQRGFMKTITDEMEKSGIHTYYIAGQAHWQNGVVERQNGWFRSIWEKVVEDKSVYALEAEWALMEVCHAKNTLRQLETPPSTGTRTTCSRRLLRRSDARR